MTRFPAEWEAQSAVMIAWPARDGDFTHLSAVEKSYCVIAHTISHVQQLVILCRNSEHRQHIEHLLEDYQNIRFFQVDYDDIWLRDTLFLTVEKDSKPVLLNFRFNGWGNKYPHAADNSINTRLLNGSLFLSPDSKNIDFVLEGGSIDSDGQGTLMTTSNCLLNPNRNPAFNKDAIEHILQQSFGCKRILWLNQPHLAGDDTDAHVDTLARFCNSETIAYTSCTDPSDPHYAPLKDMEIQLQQFRTPQGTPYQLIDLPLPSPIQDDDGCPLPANYANFLIINGAVMVPVYDDPNDQIALNKLADCFPERDIIATPCRPIVHQYGSLHCMTMHFPSNIEIN